MDGSLLGITRMIDTSFQPAHGRGRHHACAPARHEIHVPVFVCFIYNCNYSIILKKCRLILWFLSFIWISNIDLIITLETPAWSKVYVWARYRDQVPVLVRRTTEDSHVILSDDGDGYCDGIITAS